MYRVLVVDDEPVVVEGLCRQIEWDNLNMELVGTAANGLEALSMLVETEIHLLVTDICMPQMDGLTLIEKAKQIYPRIRIIVVSGHDEFEYVKKSFRLGVENYLLKPINKDELTETLTKTLENLEVDQISASVLSSDVLAFKTNILDRWVNGNIQEYELQERAELMQINLTAAKYQTLVFDMTCSSSVNKEFKHASTLLSICQKKFTSHSNTEIFLDSSLRVIVLLCAKSNSIMCNVLDDYLKKIYEQAYSEGIKSFCSVGPIVDDYLNVSSSYSTACLYLNFRLLNPAATYVTCNAPTGKDDSSLGDGSIIYPQFVKALKSENSSHALNIFQMCLAQYSACNFSEMQTAMLPLILLSIKTVIEAGRASEALSDSFRNQLSKYYTTDSKKSFKEWFSTTILSILSAIRDRKKTFHLLVNLTLEQVNKRYQEGISLKTLAAGFNTSPAYLGQLFKAETGELFNDYLTRVRLQAARSLLLETNLRIGDIIQKIGIPNQSYFNRIFRSAYGLSPMEYRYNRNKI